MFSRSVHITSIYIQYAPHGLNMPGKSYLTVHMSNLIVTCNKYAVRFAAIRRRRKQPGQYELCSKQFSYNSSQFLYYFKSYGDTNTKR